MLKQASITQIRNGEITRRDGHLVIAMCHHPRGLPRAARDEYRRDLAPDHALFREWKSREKKMGPDQAFKKSRYAKRFRLSPEGREKLSQLSWLSQRRDVYLFCQCELGARCHREMLLLLARREFGARIGMVYHRYPEFLRSAGKSSLRAA